jgi:hypothetical protein
LDDREVDKDEAFPLLPVHWRENVSTDWLRHQVHKEIFHLQKKMNIPYRGKFSWGPIFAVFVDKPLSAKIRPAK